MGPIEGNCTQYGDDARLILDSIDEVEAILLRRQARAKGEFDDAKPIIHLSGLSKKYESAGMTPVDAQSTSKMQL